MGAGIAHVFAAHGVPTAVVDATPELSEEARARALELLARLEAAGSVEEGTTATAECHLSAAPSIAAAVVDADLVVEAVFERPDVKATAYEEVEAAATADTVIATNTSSIPITELALTLRSPGRFLGVHWFVPPLLVPCVEVIPTGSTDPGVVENVVSALTALGKIAVVVGDGPGFVANRIQFAMFREAADRRGRRRDARAGRRDRPLVVRIPAPVLRSVHDRRHGGARRLRRHLRHARAWP